MREFMGPRANYKSGALYITDITNLSVQTYFVNFVDMWGLGACPENFLRFRPSEIEFKSHFSSKS